MNGMNIKPSKKHVEPTTYVRFFSTLLLLLALSVVLLSFAQQSAAQLVIVSQDGPVPTEAPYLKITMLNQQPDPVRPGQVVEVKFRVENGGQETPGPVDVEILPDYPFSLYSGEARKNIGRLRSAETGADAAVVGWKLRIDASAVTGRQPLRVRYRGQKTEWILYDTDAFSIDVQAQNSAVIISDVLAQPEQITPGGISAVHLQLLNTGEAVVRNLKITLDLSQSTFSPVRSSTQKHIPEILARANATVTYELTATPDSAAKNYNIPVQLSFEDDQGNIHNSTTVIGLTVGAEPEIEIFIQEKETLLYNAQGILHLQVVNKGVIDIKYATLELVPQGFTALSPTRVYLGDIAKDDFETVDYTIRVPTTKELNPRFVLTYKDANNKPFEQASTKTVTVYSTSEAQNLGLQARSQTWIWVVVIIFILGIIAYKVVRKKKHK